ncbi:unnamed protein product, partial [Protopolystoma xenopodis]
ERKREKEREELWKKLDQLQLSGSGDATVTTSSGTLSALSSNAAAGSGPTTSALPTATARS